jgi:energy-converting hydrogenase Eha subunit E
MATDISATIVKLPHLRNTHKQVTPVDAHELLHLNVVPQRGKLVRHVSCPHHIYDQPPTLFHHRHPGASVERPVQVRPQQHSVQRRLNLQVAALAHVGVSLLPLAYQDQVRLLASVHNARHTTRLVTALKVLHIAAIAERGLWGVR